METVEESSGCGMCCCGVKMKGEGKKKKLTINQKISLAMLASAEFISVCSMSIISPFYPAESSKKGVSETISGLVFGVYALVIFLTSPGFGKVLPKIGSKNMFIVGLFVSGIMRIIFGLINQIDDYTLFLVASFSIRIIEALSVSAYNTATFVLVSHIFPENGGAVRGLLETFIGLGFSAGPGLGGILYAVGGFGLPFYIIGTVTLLIGILNVILLPNPEKTVFKKSGSFTSLLKLCPVLITCMIITLTSATAAYIDPILEPHLRKFSLNPSQIGLFFLLLSAAYGVFSPIVGCLTDKLTTYTWLMTAGLGCNAITLLFLGPSPIFAFEDSLWLNAVGLTLLGIFIAFALIPTYQFIEDTALGNGFQDNIGTHSIIAGLWSSFYSLGEVIGPVMGGAMMENFGFAITSSTMAFLNFIGAIIAYVYFRFRKTDKSEKKRGNSIYYIESGIEGLGQMSVKSIGDDFVSARL